MNQFITILKFELKNYFKNKVFVGSTIFLVAAIALVMFFPQISSSFKSDNEDVSSDTASKIMLVKAEDENYAELIKQYFTPAFEGEYEVKITSNTLDAVKESIKKGDAQCAFVMTGIDSYTYYVDNLTMYDANTQVADSILQEVYRVNAMVSEGLSAEQVQDIMSVQIKSEVENLGVNQLENYFYTYVMIIALYMVILLYGQMVATNVASEKSSRAMEVLVTSAKPVSMMFGKVIASCIAGIVQLISVFGSAILFYNINKDYWGGNVIIESIFDMPIELLGYMIIFFILGFLVYAFLYGAIGSTASKLEDINTSSLPLTFMFVIAYIVVIVAMSSNSFDSLLMKICSYLPFTAPMAMFTRIAMTSVPMYEILISIGILIASVIGIGFVSAKIYRIGVLLYGTPPKFTAIIKAIRKA